MLTNGQPIPRKREIEAQLRKNAAQGTDMQAAAERLGILRTVVESFLNLRTFERPWLLKRFMQRGIISNLQWKRAMSAK